MTEAAALLKKREGNGAHGLPVSPKWGKYGLTKQLTIYSTTIAFNGRRSLDEVERRIEKHLRPFFGARRMAAIDTAGVRTYIAKRQAERTVTIRARDVALKNGTFRPLPERTTATAGVSNGEINRELTLLKRMFMLAIQGGKPLHKPHIPLLREENTRTGFFEPEPFEAVHAHLPAALQPIAEFAYITGGRWASEIVPLEWRHIDFKAGEIRLDPNSTKNGEGRVFPMTDDLRRILEAQHAEHLRLCKLAQFEPWIFFRLVSEGRGGKKHPKP